MTILQRLGLSRQSEALWRPPDWKDANAIKAVSGPGVYAYANDYPLSNWSNDPLQRAARNLKAYKVGWFYKAESKISRDIALLDVSVSPEDQEGDNEAEVVEPDLMTPFEQLDPMGQFLRLMERPNPNYTGRQLRQKTQIRIDMAGWAYWYLEGGDAGLPTAIYGISPTRMLPSTDGGQLIGWVMDADKPGGGIPFSVEEILPFTTANADDEEWYGVGVVDAVAAEVPLTEMMARHTADVLTTGGRLAGMIWPKDRALGPDEYVDAQRAWRNVASDPNAARRMLIFPEPMEYAAGASTPAEIGIPELAALNRDNILTAFPISPYQLGVPMPGGLNSADIRREDRRDYQEGTIHPRVELLEDAIQVGLLSRYEEVVGGSWDFDIAEPNLDTASTLIEKVGAMKALISLGFDDKASVDAVGLDHIKYNGPPPAPVLPPPPPVPDGAVGVGNVASKPAQATEPIKSADAMTHEKVVQRAVPLGLTAMRTFFAEQQQRIISGLKPTPKARKADPGDWWDAEQEDAELQKALRSLYVNVGKGSLQVVADQLQRTVTPPSVRHILNDLEKYGANRITNINEATHDAVNAQIMEGVRREYSLNQIIDGAPDEKYGGVQNALLDNGVAAFDDYRAEMIARTETMLSYNRAAVTSYREFGVEQLQAYDGDGDPECAERNGQVFTMDEALAIEDHPNGTLVWSPYLGDEAATNALAEAQTGPEPVPAEDIVAPGPTAPVSDAFTTALDKVEGNALAQRNPNYVKVTAKIKDALRTIDETFKDGNLPEMPQVGPIVNPKPGVQGQYIHGAFGKQLPQSLEFRANADMSTVFHEMSHFIDQHGIGTGDLFGSRLGFAKAQGTLEQQLSALQREINLQRSLGDVVAGSQRAQEIAALEEQLVQAQAVADVMEGVAQAIIESDGYSALLTGLKTGQVDFTDAKGFLQTFRLSSQALQWTRYATAPQEVFARAMGQYLSRKFGRSATKELETRLFLEGSKYAKPLADQWTWDDFGPIERAIEKMLDRLGWLI